MNSSPIIPFINFFGGKTKIMEIAQDTGLVKRRRKLMPDTISKVFSFGLLKMPNPSLKEIAVKCEDIQPRLKITKNGVYNRFKDVKIYDSTKISLPDKLADIWTESGGRNAKASLKLQTGYSLLFKSTFHF